MSPNPYLEALKAFLGQKAVLGTKASIAWNDLITTKTLSILIYLFKWPQSSSEWIIVILTITPFFYFKPLRNLLYFLFTRLEQKSANGIQFLRKDWFGVVFTIFLLWKLPIILILILLCRSKKLLSFLTIFACGCLLNQIPPFFWWITTISLLSANLFTLSTMVYWKIKFGGQLWSDIKLYFQPNEKYVDDTSKCFECGYSAVPIFKNHPSHPDGVSQHCPRCGSLQEKSPWIDSEKNAIAWHMHSSPFTGECSKRYDQDGKFDPKTPEYGEKWIKEYREKDGKGDGEWWVDFYDPHRTLRSGERIRTSELQKRRSQRRSRRSSRKPNLNSAE